MSRVFKSILLAGLILASLSATAAPASVMTMAISAQCNAFPNSFVNMSVQRKGVTTGPFAGSVQFNYISAPLSCSEGPTEIRCVGTWTIGGQAQVRIFLQEDGTFKGELLGTKTATGVSRPLVMSCLLSRNQIH